ncbi:hypothetical protein F2Q69_00015304 [Brassica cretica]|uniref:Uncharacterized protein n=1 Tax=Brassica cretica TaxID=69181 RepID=A0A8S9QSJ8_BRACR|nr:hypothetical protein F2Q69_00015304 [Brassica cretica]
MARKTGSAIGELRTLLVEMHTTTQVSLQQLSDTVAQQQVCPHQQWMCRQNQIDDARVQVIQLDDDEVDESFIEDNESHSQASDVEVFLQKYGFLVVDGNNLALDIASTTDYSDNWAFKNYGPIHHRDEEHVDLIYNHSLSWQLRGIRERKDIFFI